MLMCSVGIHSCCAVLCIYCLSPFPVSLFVNFAGICMSGKRKERARVGKGAKVISREMDSDAVTGNLYVISCRPFPDLLI